MTSDPRYAVAALMQALDHPNLRKVLGEIEGSAAIKDMVRHDTLRPWYDAVTVAMAEGHAALGERGRAA